MVLRDSGVVAVDTGLSDEHLSLLGCGVTAGVGAVLNLAEVQAGSSVAVIGCGALGLWMIQGARVAGATTIVAVEPRAERRELARAVGATHALDPADGDPVAAVKALTGGRGADYALEAAGPPEAMAQALAMTRPAGTMVPAGLGDAVVHGHAAGGRLRRSAASASRAASTAARTSAATSRASRGCSRPGCSTPTRSSAAASPSRRSTRRWRPR